MFVHIMAYKSHDKSYKDKQKRIVQVQIFDYKFEEVLISIQIIFVISNQKKYNVLIF